MDRYILNTVDYDYKALNHEGFGGVCKYIAAPKRDGLSRLLVKHENIQSACNTFMCSRLAELCGVYTPKAYLMSTSDETRRLFPMHPFIVGTEWVEDFSAVDYGSIKESPALRQQYLDSMALYAMFCRIADTPQFAYSPAKGVCNCRKPRPGLFYYAAAQFNIDFRKSFAVGNELRDLCICSYEPVTGILLSEDNDPVGESGDSIICLNDLYSACRFISEHG